MKTLAAVPVLLLLSGSGVMRQRPVVSANVALTAQSGVIGPADLITAAPAGLYRLTGYVQVTDPSTGACTGTSAFGWTYNGAAKSGTLFAALDMSVDENIPSLAGANPGVRHFRVDAGTAITHSYTPAGADCSTLTYDYFLTLERLQW